MRTVCILTLAALGVMGASAAMIDATTGTLILDIGDRSVTYLPDPTPNLTITGDFETAMEGDTISGVINAFNFATLPTSFATGRYRLTLGVRPNPASNVSLSFIDPTTFEGTSLVNLLATFTFVGTNTECSAAGNCGDVLGEFGSLPGIENCVTAGGEVSAATCDVSGLFALSGNYVSAGPTGGVTGLSGVTVELAAVPEPSTVLLTALGAAALLLRRKHI